MRVFVTGGAGFIGSNLVHSLLASGHQVGVIDDFSTGKPENLHPWAWHRTMDILDPAMPAAMAEFAPEIVVHLAAQASVTESLRDPERDFAVNATGTQLVAGAAAAAGARRVISASSAAVYGEPDLSMLPLAEDAPKSPINPYGESKLAAEKLIADELRGSSTDFVSFRFANVYGPRQDALGEGGVVAIFSAKMAAGEKPVIFGDGKQTRDFIYVGDIVGAIVSAALAEGRLAGDGDDGPAYNISTGTETSLDSLVMALRAASMYMGGVDHAPAREGDIVRSSLDPSKAADAFDWRAAAELSTGIASTWAWFAGRQ